MGWKKNDLMVTDNDKMKWSYALDGLMLAYLFGNKRKNADTLISERYLKVDDTGVLRVYTKERKTVPSKKGKR